GHAGPVPGDVRRVGRRRRLDGSDEQGGQLRLVSPRRSGRRHRFGIGRGSAKELLGKIKETAGKPGRFLVITHAHGDHAGGIGPFVAAGATVICQEHAAAPVATLAAQESGSKSGVVVVSDSMAFYGSSRRVAIYHLGAAHTQGDLVIWLPDDK